MKRLDGREVDELRHTEISLGQQEYAEGSALIKVGMTKVLCAVSVEKDVPDFLNGTGRGWIRSEYAMLPRSTFTRRRRETVPRGRTQEIQRLIGRSLRAVVDLELIDGMTFTIDCDGIQADGGTRTAAVTGSYVALYQAFFNLLKDGVLKELPFRSAVAATSVGVVNDKVFLDLCYEEDYKAEVDFNLVMTDTGKFVEMQGTAEKNPFSGILLDKILSVGEKGIKELNVIQENVINEFVST